MATHQPTAGAGLPEYQAVVVCGSDGHIKGTKNTYVIGYKMTDATLTGQALSLAFTANQVRQVATIWHAAASTRRKTLKRVEVHLAATAATILGIQLVRITSAPATALAATTANIIPMVSDHIASDALAMCAPTTAGTAAADAALFVQEINLGANTAQTTNFDIQPIVIFPPLGMPADDDFYEPVIRAGVLEGYAVRMQSTAAVTIKATVRIIFTEE